MAWTTPSTRATGDLITASIWNADIVNNFLELYHLLDNISTTSAVNVSTTAVGGDQIAIGASRDYTAYSDVVIELIVPDVTVADSCNAYIERDGLGTYLGKQEIRSAGQAHVVWVDTSPPNSTYAYEARAYVDTNPTTLQAGAGADRGTYEPLRMRVYGRGA